MVAARETRLYIEAHNRHQELACRLMSERSETLRDLVHRWYHRKRQLEPRADHRLIKTTHVPCPGTGGMYCHPILSYNPTQENVNGR